LGKGSENMDKFIMLARGWGKNKALKDLYGMGLEERLFSSQQRHSESGRRPFKKPKKLRSSRG
jgi:hypothetical protein